MIGTFLQGGLGNYMFQIAVSYSIAIDNNTDSVFNINNAVRVHKNINEYKNNILRNVKIIPNPQYKIQYIEPSFEYKKINYIDGLYLVGYFQSEKYFLHNRSSILKLFEPTKSDKEYINKKYHHLLNKKNCSVHVRRGDYLKIQDHHVLCSLDYYKEASKIIGEDTNFIIFSDDIQWCKENLHFKNCHYIENENDYIEMYLMSMCDDNIIANSSFSWWGAWLNQNKDKKVIAPKKWFGQSKSNLITKDIYAEKWLVI